MQILVAAPRETLVLLFLACVVLLAPVSAVAEPTQSTPNILLIIADDMGYGDMSCMGSTILKTPHLDALAGRGWLCTQGYVASSVCAPSRAGLITGRHPVRIGFESNLAGRPDNPHTKADYLGLAPTERTLGDHLKHNGYRTGLVGKWHLGYEASHHPNKRGFDYFCGILEGHHGYFLEPGKGKFQRMGEPVTEFSSGYATDFLTDEAVGFIDRESERDEPWFLYLSYTAPHTPMHALEEDLAVYSHVQNPRRRAFCAMMHALDRGIGRISAKLEAQGELDNTLIVFISDNGGATPANEAWNGPLTGCKGTKAEGGIRVPFIVSWPARFPAGEIYTSPVSALDLLPTFLAACAGETLALTDGSGRNKKPRVYDGIDLVPFFASGDPTPDRALFWRLQGQTALVLNGAEKLIRLSHKPAQLFDLATDLSEQNDLAAANPQRLRDLFQMIHDWERSMPTYPHFYASPYWQGPSADRYEQVGPRGEPK
ncbi:MAG: sulfatase-like hydrolase/transferase [Planctomycetota bacterium]